MNQYSSNIPETVHFDPEVYKRLEAIERSGGPTISESTNEILKARICQSVSENHPQGE